ncbi:aspartic proteinase CDR1-like [Trifolium pratense]|uniref:aspartic proteinase CDR1-like n=1 Tax=Trifolium pratense TaxID=57577 RepID=UPI001E693D99|nr:aspartic proteinase CDR1-like [Trifolium pratense]
MNARSFFTLLVFTLFCFIISLSRPLNNGFTVELIHRDSPKSPLYQPTQNKYQLVTNAMRRSIDRVNHIYNYSIVNIGYTTVTSGDGEYLISYSIGTPPFKVYGFVDTGSDLVWLQCEPCVQCYPQTSPIFDPSLSSSYKNIPCYDDTCLSTTGTSCDVLGYLSVDTLTLDSTNGNSVSFPNTVVGCGYINNGTLHGPSSSGIVGLGNGENSFATRWSSSIGGKFSYCLVSSLSKSTSKLNFGDAAVVSGDGAMTTPIVKKNGQSFYYLTLEAFSVNDKLIEFSEPTNDGNIIIDSGTTHTFLPYDLYNRLESAVAENINKERVKDPNGIFNLCYDITFEGFDDPLIIAHFKGADIRLHSNSTFVAIGEGIICLAFSPYKMAILGNMVQQNMLVGYNLVQNTVTFMPTDCTK